MTFEESFADINYEMYLDEDILEKRKLFQHLVEDNLDWRTHFVQKIPVNRQWEYQAASLHFAGCVLKVHDS